MTPEARISHDLAILGRVSRDRPLPLSTTLQHVGAEAAPIVRAAVSTRDQTALLPLARIYVHRVARTWAGGTLAVLTLALFAFVAVTRSGARRHEGILYEPLFAHVVWPFVVMMVPVLATYALASSLAMRRFDDVTIAEARERVDRMGRWSVGLPVFGISVVCVFFGIMFITLGDWGLIGIFDADEEQRVHHVAHQSLALCAAAFVVCGVLAAVLSNRRASLAWSIPIGAAVVFVTALIGMRYDIGPIHETLMFQYNPSFALRASLTASGTLGLIALVGGVLLWRRAREDRELAPSSD